jgi:hypothetical protein
MNRPLSYAERSALAKGLPPDPHAMGKARTTVERIMKLQLPTHETRKDTHMSATDEALALVQKAVANGEYTNAGDAYVELAKRHPALFTRARQEPLTRVSTPGSPSVIASDPPGILKSVDGKPASWDKQVQYWKEHPEERRRYEARFRVS